MSRLFPSLAIALCISAGAVADVSVGYSVDGDDPGTPEIEVQPGINPLTIGLSSTEGGFVAGGFMFRFEDAAIPDVTLSSFVWDDAFSDVNRWFADPTLPNPVAFAAVGGLAVPPDPGQVDVATLDLGIGSVPFGTLLTLPTGAQVFTPAAVPADLTPGSDSIVMRVVPEPSAIALLAFGLALLVWRR